MTTGPQFAFGRFRLDAGARVLFRDDTRIQLTPKAIDVLLTLIERRGVAVGREDLFQRVWADAAVEDGTLSSHISILRKTLGGEFIETIPKRGYRFVGDVDEIGDRRPLLVVLPFGNLGGRDDDAFADGLTEEVITQLGRLSPARLGVIARTSSMTYRSTEKTIAQIGRELGVAYALEGSVRRAGNRVRIAAQLIQVSDQTHLWTDAYESELEDILTLQSRVSREVANQIRIRLVPAELTRLENAKQVVPAAYAAYLTGRYLWNRRGERDLQTSITSFEQAIASDPGYAPPYAGLADTYLTLMDRGDVPQREAMQKARPLLVRAVQLDERLAEPHVSLGHAALHEFDWTRADRELRRAIELNPSYASARHYYGNYLAAMQRIDAAVAEAEHAARLDPVSAATHSNLSSILWFAGEHEQSIIHAQRALELNPSYARAYDDIGRAYEQLGAFDRAIDALQQAVALEERADAGNASLAHACALAGKRSEAVRILRNLELTSKSRFVAAYNFALIHVALGDVDNAFAWLDKAYDERSSALPFLRVNPRLAGLRDDPRFVRLCRRVFA